MEGLAFVSPPWISSSMGTVSSTTIFTRRFTPVSLAQSVAERTPCACTQVKKEILIETSASTVKPNKYRSYYRYFRGGIGIWIRSRASQGQLLHGNHSICGVLVPHDQKYERKISQKGDISYLATNWLNGSISWATEGHANPFGIGTDTRWVRDINDRNSASAPKNDSPRFPGQN